MSVCVCCSSNDLADRYMAPARQLAELIAEHGHRLVWGGSYAGVIVLPGGLGTLDGLTEILELT